MKPDTVTAIILTYEEEANIARCLARLNWAGRILVVDSGSSDRTAEIVRQAPRCKLIQRDFDSHAGQWNFAVGQAASDWVLALDADYILADGWPEELEELDPQPDTAAYEAHFVYQIHGHSLRASLYPPRPVLFQRSNCEYWDDGHTQRLRVGGETEPLRSLILHDDRKPLEQWLRAQLRYSELEAKKLLQHQPQELRRIDRLRRLGGPMVLLMPLYCLLFKGLLLDGWPGWYYTLQRTGAEILLSLRILEARLGVRGEGR